LGTSVSPCQQDNIRRQQHSGGGGGGAGYHQAAGGGGDPAEGGYADFKLQAAAFRVWVRHASALRALRVAREAAVENWMISVSFWECQAGGVTDNNHSTDVEYPPPPPPRVYMSILHEGIKS
jgi:hypothetical protein